MLQAMEWDVSGASDASDGAEARSHTPDPLEARPSPPHVSRDSRRAPRCSALVLEPTPATRSARARRNVIVRAHTGRVSAPL